MARPPQARRFARALLLVILLGGILGAVALLALTSARSAERSLRAARGDLERGVAAITEGDIAAAAEAFADGRAHADRAVAELRTPQLRLINFLPVIGATAESATAVAEAAALVSQAGDELLSDVESLPGGLDALIPRDQRVPTELADLAPGFERTHVLLSLAESILASAPANTLVDTVDEARAELATELSTVTPRLEQLAALARALPAFLGADGPRRYLVGAQNPAELRGTGGFIGAIAILEVDDGRLSIGDFVSTGDLPRDLPPPVVSNPDYLQRWGTYVQGQAGGRWVNLNVSPHVPSAAQAILSSYRSATGEDLDGFVLVDPFALQALMSVTGPTDVPRIGQVTAETVVDVVANQAPAYFDDRGERKETLGEVAAAVLLNFLSGGHDPAAQARALAGAAGGGHVQLYSVNPSVQADLQAARLAGELPPPDPGYLGVFGINASETKLDFYVDRTVSYEVFLNPDGSANAIIEVGFDNHAPTSGLPAYTIGPSPNLDLAAGEALTVLNVYCGPCELMSTTRTSDYLHVSVEAELGHTVLETWEPVAAEARTTTRHVVFIPSIWRRDGNEGVVTLTYQNQATIRPTDFSLTVHPPAGWRLEPADDRLTLREGGALAWDDTVGPLTHFPANLSRIAAVVASGTSQ